MSNLRDVAKKAGVSVATVSRYLNGIGYVSEETGEKIKRAIEKLDYTPNELARNFFRNKTGIVAVLVPDSGHPFFSEFVKYVEAELYNYGYKVMLCNTIYEADREQQYLDMLKRQMVDGIITGVYALKDVEKYMDVNRPIVALDCYLGEYIPSVTVDHEYGGELVAMKFIESGCKRVLQFQGHMDVNANSRKRNIEFARVMKEHGISVVSYPIEWKRFDTKYYQDLAHKVFCEYPGIDGIFGTDLPAAYCLKVAIQQGRRVPEDLKLIAYDGTYITDIIEPQLTTIVQPLEELAREAAKLLMRRIQGKVFKDKEVILGVSLREGKTT